MTKLPSLTSILTVFCIILILVVPIPSVRPVFADTIFEDGFETGDLSKWTPTGGNPSVTSGDAHHGNYKAVLDATNEYAQKRFTGIDHCFMRAYVMFKSFPALGTETAILGVYNWASSKYMAEARVGNFVGGTVKWRFRYYDNGVHYIVTSEQQKPVLDTWYCVEVEGKSNSATNSEARLYINGNELTDISKTGINNTLPITCAYIWVNNAVTHWYDCVVVDTAYIGPEQCYLTVSSPYGTAGGQGWYNYGSTAYATLDTGEVNHDNGTRHIFTNWNGDATGTNYASSDPITMTSNKTATTVWETQYNVTFTQTGLDSSASGTVVTVNDIPIDFTQLPYSVWVDKGDTVTYSYSNVSSTTSAQRFALVSVSGETSPITIAGPVQVQGNYVTQYDVVFDQTGIGSDYAGTIITIDGEDYGYTALPTEFWWDSESVHTFSFSSPLVVNASKRYNWASTSGLSNLQSDTLTIMGSGSVTGNYGTQTDVTPPEISILSPENKTYYTPNIVLEFEINEAVSWIGYSLDGLANVTISGNTTIDVGEGSHWIIVYANDSSGNVGSSNKVYFTARIGISDIAIVDIQPSKTLVGQSFSMTVNVTVQNQGDYLESFNVTLYGNATIIGILENVILPAGSNVIITFSWNTTYFAKGNYTITAYVEPVLGETDIEDNTSLGGSIYVGIPGDVATRYGQVDMKDIGNVIKAFGSVPGDLKWNANMDINGDGKVDMKDIGIAIKHFGEIDN